MKRYQRDTPVERLEPRQLLSAALPTVATLGSRTIPATTAANVQLIGSVQGQYTSDLSVDAAGDVLGTVADFPTYGEEDDAAFGLAAGRRLKRSSDPRAQPSSTATATCSA